jgi:hypothetical protein
MPKPLADQVLADLQPAQLVVHRGEPLSFGWLPSERLDQHDPGDAQDLLQVGGHLAALFLGAPAGLISGLPGSPGGQRHRRDHHRDRQGQLPGERQHQGERGDRDQRAGDQPEHGVGDHVLDAVDVGVDPRQQVTGLAVGEERDRLVQQPAE